MAKYPTLLEQFRSFYLQNNPKDLESAIEYFAIFGGMGWDVDTTKPLLELIENKVLKNYTYINGDITKVTKSDKITHALLTGAALGDARTHSAIKRARITYTEGGSAIEDLSEMGFITVENSLESPPYDAEIADKIRFAVPFMRFWFAFVSPYFKGIKEGDFTEARERFTNREAGFAGLIFEKLSLELLKKTFKDDPIVEAGGYWDRDVEIEILAKTKSGKIVAGACKYSSSKANKTELTKLMEKCAKAELTPDVVVLFSKSGFSNELKNEKSDTLKLYDLKKYRTLIEEIKPKEIIPCIGKKY